MLIDCPECGKQISDLAKSCPQCGAPVLLAEAYEENRQIERGFHLSKQKPADEMTVAEKADVARYMVAKEHVDAFDRTAKRWLSPLAWFVVVAVAIVPLALLGPLIGWPMAGLIIIIAVFDLARPSKP